ncbi:hypothetical protein SAMN05216389_11266 [Oceanobacillus limi]|uniref:Signal transducing protein n=1 Tax=Oceanobacillus limi TaxID=930131 RepID=A0A1I0ER65_9BACI|nr:hypothetical protein [Oceanobacillus limi]SET48016.1 hypothetical protein SAMN05216389_11266 [Oceanobacillus limi]
MIEILLIIVALTLMWRFRDSNENVTIYSGDESTLDEANEYYWVLKNNNIPIKYQIPYRWENFFVFGYKRSPVYIKVRKNDVLKARQIMWCYRKDKMKMERNIKL